MSLQSALYLLVVSLLLLFIFAIIAGRLRRPIARKKVPFWVAIGLMLVIPLAMFLMLRAMHWDILRNEFEQHGI
jgi:hypothetical protein